MKAELLRMDKVTYLENGVMQLNRFNLHIFKGEIMGLICINSHGLEALIALLQQNLPLHYGSVYYRETLVNTYRHTRITTNKVAVIQKQSRLVEGMTVGDNVFVLRGGFRKYVIQPRVLAQQLRIFTQELGIEIDANEPVEHLSFFERCVVELFKAVVADARLIAIRDISNFVSVTDLAKIHKILEHYAKMGVSFLYVCNHHEEAFRICHRAALMKNGEIIKLLDQRDMRDDLMKTYSQPFYALVEKRRKETAARSDGMDGLQEDAVFSAEQLYSQHLRGLSFQVKKGECIVLQDMDNSLLQPLLDLLSGKESLKSGKLLLGQEDITHAIERNRNLAVIGEKPTQSMLFLDLSYMDNLCFNIDHRLPRIWRGGAIRQSIAEEYGAQLGDVMESDVRQLTAAQQYSLVYHRILLQKPQVVFCVQPFSGADMYLRMHIMRLIQKLLQKQIAVVIPAVSLSDSLAVANRLLVVEHGRVQHCYLQSEFNHLLGTVPWCE